MSPSTSRKPDGSSYLYYISQARIKRREADPMRPIPADTIETIVCERVAGLVTPTRSGNEIREHLRDLITRVDIGAERTTITLNRNSISQQLKVKDDQIAATLRARLPADETLDESDGNLVLSISAQIPRRGGVRRVEGWEKSDWTRATVRHDAALIKALVEAHEWRKLIESGEILTMEDLSARTRHDRKYVRHTLKLAFLAPDIQRAILDGRQPRSLTAPALADLDLPMLWSEQRSLLSFAAA